MDDHIIVGYDGSQASATAARWAATEADRRHTSLTIVGCYLVRRGMSGADALRALAQLRRFAPDADIVSPETEAQRQFVRLWQPGI